MAVKSKTQYTNLLVDYQREKVPYEAIYKLVCKFLEDKKNHNYYSKTVFEALEAFYGERYEDHTTEKTYRFMTQMFMEFLDHLSYDLKVSYYDKEMTKIVIYHSPSNKG